MTHSNLTASGSKSQITVTAGIRAISMTIGVLIRQGTGFTPTPAGLGIPRNRTAGRFTTMAVGRTSRTSAGHGSLALSGRRRGCPGGTVIGIPGGRRFLRRRTSRPMSHSGLGWIPITILGQQTTRSWKHDISVLLGLPPWRSRFAKTSRSLLRRATSRTSSIAITSSSTRGLDMMTWFASARSRSGACGWTGGPISLRSLKLAQRCAREFKATPWR